MQDEEYQLTAAILSGILCMLATSCPYVYNNRLIAHIILYRTMDHTMVMTHMMMVRMAKVMVVP